MSKAVKFLEKLYIDIKELLLVTFWVFDIFFLKNNAWDIFFILSIKTKEEIYDKLVDF